MRMKDKDIQFIGFVPIFTGSVAHTHTHTLAFSTLRFVLFFWKDEKWIHLRHHCFTSNSRNDFYIHKWTALHLSQRASPLAAAAAPQLRV